MINKVAIANLGMGVPVNPRAMALFGLIPIELTAEDFPTIEWITAEASYIGIIVEGAGKGVTAENCPALFVKESTVIELVADSTQIRLAVQQNSNTLINENPGHENTFQQ